jgi:hypothetical protein
LFINDASDHLTHLHAHGDKKHGKITIHNFSSFAGAWGLLCTTLIAVVGECDSRAAAVAFSVPILDMCPYELVAEEQQLIGGGM